MMVAIKILKGGITKKAWENAWRANELLKEIQAIQFSTRVL
jgi:hypothetical protein